MHPAGNLVASPKNRSHSNMIRFYELKWNLENNSVKILQHKMKRNRELKNTLHFNEHYYITEKWKCISPSHHIYIYIVKNIRFFEDDHGLSINICENIHIILFNKRQNRWSLSIKLKKKTTFARFKWEWKRRETFRTTVRRVWTVKWLYIKKNHRSFYKSV